LLLIRANNHRAPTLPGAESNGKEPVFGAQPFGFKLAGCQQVGKPQLAGSSQPALNQTYWEPNSWLTQSLAVTLCFLDLRKLHRHDDLTPKKNICFLS